MEPSRTVPAALDDLYPLVYDELKRVARQQLRASASTLSTTELVHETFLKLAANPPAGWEGRSHFFGTAARAMRQVLVDFARRRGAAKRGGELARVSLSDAEGELAVELDEIVALDEALDRLDAVDPRLRQVVELRFFAGLAEREVAELLGVTPRTVERDWVKARLLLLRDLEAGR
ncbi:MAG: ECF-type sigma factor [Gemmatimonadales bacterium]